MCGMKQPREVMFDICVGKEPRERPPLLCRHASLIWYSLDWNSGRRTTSSSKRRTANSKTVREREERAWDKGDETERSKSMDLN